MSFEPKKYKDIFDEMRGRTSQLTDFEVGSVTRTIYESFAYEMALLYEKMNLVYLSAYVDTAQEFQLDQVVAILGVKRGLPDFSVGTVVFERDAGSEEIAIPLGTLVATEDSEENPKKVYQTIEQKVLAQNQTTVEVKVQAVERGEEQDTDDETVVVMPRPIPGIKSVNNPEAIKLVGKRRETDEELRERSKTVLISSGKANILAVENAVLSLPGVLDVKVQESFHFAQGEIDINRTNLAEVQTIARGSILTIGAGDEKKTYFTKDDLQFKIGDASEMVRIQAFQEGKFGELPAYAGLAFENPDLDTDFTVDNEKAIQLGNFGVIEVFVDAPDFEEPAVKESIENAIDDVRAAGIYVILEAAQRIEVDLVLRIEAGANLNFTPEERLEFEQTVQSSLEDFFLAFKLGDTFAFSQMIKAVISVEGVENLEDFKLQISKKAGDTIKTLDYEFSNNKIHAGENERFIGRYLCVASEDKPLPIHLEFKVNNAATHLPNLQNNLANFFQNQPFPIPADQPLKQSDIEAEITSIVEEDYVAETLKINAESWCPRPMLEEDEGDFIVKASFVEFPVLGDIFAYQDELEITGALQLIIPNNINQEDRQSIYDNAENAIQNYLDNLKAEEEIFFEDLAKEVQKVDQILVVNFDATDFQVFKDGSIQPDRVTEEKISLEPFEKAVAGNFCVSSEVERVEVSVTAIELELTDYPDDAVLTDVINDVQLVVAHAINNYLLISEQGDDISFVEFRTAISNRLPDVSYQVNEFSLEAKSLCDNRMQTATITAPNDLHVRSIELPVIVPIVASTIVVNDGS